MRLTRRSRRHVWVTSPLRIVLVRHGRPAISTKQRTSHRGFSEYIDDYEAAGLDSESMPPEELQELVGQLSEVFTSSRPRSQESAQAIAPHAELISDRLFEEAPLAPPHIPLVKFGVATWAVMSRILWHAGYHPEIENYRRAKQRAKAAADILIFKAQEDGTSVLVAHGYFNAMIGRELVRRGFHQAGRHRVRFWNAVIYELG